MNNFFYYFRESRAIYRTDRKTNFFSVISIGLVLLIFMAFFGVAIVGQHLIEILSDEAEIAIYYHTAMNEASLSDLEEMIGRFPGVRSVERISEEKEYERMGEMLGKDATILELFDENPFRPALQIKVDIGEREALKNKLGNLQGIEYVRDNEEVLTKLETIIATLRLILVILLIAISTVSIVVVQHIIRQGIYNNREQINTLKLLGAPNSFIGMPYLLQGLTTTLKSALGTMILGSAIFALIYSSSEHLTVIPLPPLTTSLIYSNLAVLLLSILLGILGSLVGLKTIKD